jgi:polar amino acid transport system substrate-binding protein
VVGNSARGVGGGIAAVGRLVLEQGEIRENQAEGGGGVAAYEGCSFVMLDGVIEDNQSTVAGGGLVLNRSVSMRMEGGRINGNRSGSGGGLALIEDCSFTMTGGEIRNNQADEHGGGLASDETSTVAMEGGTLGGNGAGSWGGGVFTAGYFSKSAGLIWGSDALEEDANRAETGASVYLYQGARGGVSRETTLGEDETVNGPGFGELAAAQDEPEPLPQDFGLTIKPGVLTVGMEIGYPPMEYFDTDGKTPIGFDVELAKAIAAKLGYGVEFVDTAWDGIFAGVSAGEYDCIISSVTYTGERAANYNFTKPYVANSQLLVVRNDSKVKPKTLQEVVGLRLTYQAETTSDTLATEWIASNNAKIEVFEYDKVMNCFDELNLGRVDVILVDSVVAADYLAKPGNPYEITAEVSNDEVLAICLKKGNDALTDVLNKALDDLYADGTLKRISQSVFGTDVVSSVR